MGMEGLVGWASSSTLLHAALSTPPSMADIFCPYLCPRPAHLPSSLKEAGEVEPGRRLAHGGMDRHGRQDRDWDCMYLRPGTVMFSTRARAPPFLPSLSHLPPSHPRTALLLLSASFSPPSTSSLLSSMHMGCFKWLKQNMFCGFLRAARAPAHHIAHNRSSPPNLPHRRDNLKPSTPLFRLSFTFFRSSFSLSHSPLSSLSASLHSLHIFLTFYFFLRFSPIRLLISALHFFFFHTEIRVVVVRW